MTTLTTREPDKLISEIIASELGLNLKQCLIQNQKFNIPNDDKLYISIGYVSGAAIGSSNSTEEIDGVFSEVQEVSMHHLVQIDVYSFGDEARSRKEEVIMALRSIKSQQLQEANRMQIARIPSHFSNASEVDTTERILTRYIMTVAVFSLYRKVKAAGYLTNFPTEIFNSNTDKVEVDVTQQIP